MKRFKKRKNLKISKVIYIVVALIFFFTYILFNLYSKVTSDKLIDVAFIKLNEFMEGFLSNNINFDLLKDDVMKDIIVINKNKEGEILYVTYDMDQAYYALEVVTQELETAISDLENGNKSVKSRNIVSGGKGIALRMPFLLEVLVCFFLIWVQVFMFQLILLVLFLQILKLKLLIMGLIML